MSLREEASGDAPPRFGSPWGSAGWLGRAALRDPSSRRMFRKIEHGFGHMHFCLHLSENRGRAAIAPPEWHIPKPHISRITADIGPDGFPTQATTETMPSA